MLDEAGNLSRFTATFEESWHEDVASDARVRALRAVSVRNRAALEICPNPVRAHLEGLRIGRAASASSTHRSCSPTVYDGRKFADRKAVAKAVSRRFAA